MQTIRSLHLSSMGFVGYLKKWVFRLRGGMWTKRCHVCWEKRLLFSPYF